MRRIHKIFDFQIEALSEIVANFPSRKGFEIYFDGGIRGGLDVFRALAIGAKYVFVGRAPMYGLFHSVSKEQKFLCEIFIIISW